MRKKMWAALITGILVIHCMIPVAALETTPPSVTAQAYIVADLSTGQILLQNGIDEKQYPASITKIMTIALALEKCSNDLTVPVTVSESAVAAVEPGSSYVALQAGEEVTLADIFYATMLMSANDGANVLAEYVSKDIETFVVLMNEKAQQLGMVNTHFANPSGWHEEDHYTTPADMVKLVSWAMNVPGFTKLFGAADYEMQPTNLQPLARKFGTDNVMRVESQMTYPGTIGGKSGWTEEAGYTLVEVAQRNENTLIAIVFGCPKQYDKFKDCIALFDYCFQNFASVTISSTNISPQKVQVVDHNEVIGFAPLEVRANFLLHYAYQLEDVQIDYLLPDFYVQGETFYANAVLSLKEDTQAMYPQILNVPVGFEGDIFLAETPEESQPEAQALTVQMQHPQATKSVVWLVLKVVLGVFGVLVLLILLRIAYVAYIKAKRKKARQARRARLRKRQTQQMRAQNAASVRRKPNVAQNTRNRYNKV